MHTYKLPSREDDEVLRWRGGSSFQNGKLAGPLLELIQEHCLNLHMNSHCTGSVTVTDTLVRCLKTTK